MTGPLILIPTPPEQEVVQPALRPVVERLGGHIALCGFGIATAAARTAHLIATHNPEIVYLTGIAGSFVEHLSPGSAHSFSRVSCYGIGAGTGDDFQTAEQLGWPQWSADGAEAQIGDTLPLSDTSAITGPETQTDLHLLTACSASASASDVSQRLACFPNAAAEDMEAFAVAVACHLAKTPLVVVRGISNMAGDPNKQNWHIPQALRSATDLTLRHLTSYTS